MSKPSLRSTVVILGLVSVLFAAEPARAELTQTAEVLSVDGSLAAAVARRVRREPLGSSAKLSLSSTSGHLRAKGTVETLVDRERIVACIESSEGVRSFDVSLPVRPIAELADESLRRRVEEALTRVTSGLRERASVGVRARGRRVTLSGVVRSTRDWSLLLETVRSVPGVQALTDELTLEVAMGEAVLGTSSSREERLGARSIDTRTGRLLIEGVPHRVLEIKSVQVDERGKRRQRYLVQEMTLPAP
ncbi:MAG: BON domain-containing protein [Acidobacteriota bacterium]